MREALFKIVDACPCDCQFCDSNENYRVRFGRQTHTLETWIRMADDLISNGLEVAIITGGDPLLKRNVALPLITHLRSAGVFVVLNTSGAQFASRTLLGELTESYPDLMVFSIDSANADQHDLSRVRPGLFALITSTIEQLRQLPGRYPVGIRTVVTRQNYDQLPLIIRTFHDLDVDCIKLTHIEDDKDRAYLLTESQLHDFDSRIRGEILDEIAKCTFETDHLRSDAVAKVNDLLSQRYATYEQLANGEFSPHMKGRSRCDIVERFGAVQSSGEVLPCCEAEHHFDPVLGNLTHESASTIYRSDAYLDILHNRRDYCTRCTEPHNLQLTFRESTAKVQQR